LTGNSAGLRTVLSSRLSHRELRSSRREFHSFLSLPADTMTASSQDTQPSKMNKREATLEFIEAYRSLPELSDTENIMADVASKQQATAFFLSTIVTRTRTHIELTKKLTNVMGNLCCVREYSFQFSVQFLHTVKPHSLPLRDVGRDSWCPDGKSNPCASCV